MGARHRIVLTNRLWPLGIAAGYFICAILALELTRSSNGIAFVWPASGVLLAGLLLSPSGNRIAVLVLVAGASMIANVWAGSDVMPAIGFTAANLIEGLVAARVATSGGNDSVSFERPQGVAWFAAGAVTGGVISAVIATPFAATSDPMEFYVSWFVTVTLGMLIVTPALIISLRGLLAHEKHRSRNSLIKGAAIHVLALAVALLTFGQSDYPLLILPSTMVIFATYFLGFSGAVGSVLISTVVAVMLTTSGFGPIAGVGNPQERIIFFQFYILTMLASAMPLAALLEKSRRDAARLKESNSLLEAAERTAHVGHWRYDLSNQEILWSDEVYRIHGIPMGEPMTRDRVVALYHSDDHARIDKAFERAIKDGEAFFYESRIVWPDGTIRQVESRGEAERAGSRAVALFGIVLDVTERNETLEALAKARRLAERRASEATRMAETDQLTGVANRRRVLTYLKQEMDRADREQTGLAIAMVDADHFKVINDSFGHAAGDAVLKQIAKTSTACLEEGDMFGRLGGEEFLIVLPGADEERATQVAELVRNSIMSMRIAEVSEETVTVSLGVAVFQQGSDQTWLLQAADSALYQSKRDGRNRLTLAA